MKDLMVLGLFLVEQHVVLVNGNQHQQLEHGVGILAVVERLVVQQQLEELVDVVHFEVVVRVLFEKAEVQRPEQRQRNVKAELVVDGDYLCDYVHNIIEVGV